MFLAAGGSTTVTARRQYQFNETSSYARCSSRRGPAVECRQ